jgi:hypothetical protein
VTSVLNIDIASVKLLLHCDRQFGKESYYDELSKELDAMERARVHAAKIMRNADDPAHLKMVNMVLKK